MRPHYSKETRLVLNEFMKQLKPQQKYKTGTLPYTLPYTLPEAILMVRKCTKLSAKLT